MPHSYDFSTAWKHFFQDPEYEHLVSVTHHSNIKDSKIQMRALSSVDCPHYSKVPVSLHESYVVPNRRIISVILSADSNISMY